MPSCMFCNAEEVAEVHEVWGHDFMLDTCCEAMRDHLAREMVFAPKEAADWLSKELGSCVPPIRRVVDDGFGALLLDYQLRLVPVSFREMADFVAEHHRHCPPPRGWKFGMGIVNGSRSFGGLLGVVSCGRPVARALDQQKIVEVNRLCIDPSAPQALAWNAASMLYGWAAKEAKRRGAHWIITYTLESESGTSVRAAGWIPGHITKGRNWSSPSRARSADHAGGDKVRWHRRLAEGIDCVPLRARGSLQSKHPSGLAEAREQARHSKATLMAIAPKSLDGEGPIG